MIERLLKAGANVNAPVLAHGETALMMAARTGNLDAVKMLLDHGADVNAKETLRGTGALMWAAEQGHVEIIELLIAKGADVKAQSSTIVPPRRRGLGFAPPNAKGEAPPKGGLTALLFAVRQGSLDCVKALLHAGRRRE